MVPWTRLQSPELLPVPVPERAPPPQSAVVWGQLAVWVQVQVQVLAPIRGAETARPLWLLQRLYCYKIAQKVDLPLFKQAI